ncbi:hypothetical protein CDL12_08725 [Handroanthus impetiginosus]|uniref:Uncharacterized protein n=1 Tax=Handroanthus impetiginosus TaxID=429701 RepID=A0A2G9HME5_9LAMI|nr:hypothetical protein CDL12_08725 [Handroanthus impetiginosus]
MWESLHGYFCILIPRLRDEELIEFSRFYRWGECKLPNKVHNAKDRLKSIMAEMFNPISQELYLLNSNNIVVDIVKAKDQEIKELKKRVVELKAATKDEKEKKKKEKKTEEDKQKKRKTDERKDDKEGKKKDSEDEERKKKDDEKEEERKYGNDEEHDHNADNKYNDMNEENQIKHRAGQVSCHYEVKMNKKLEVISRKLDFGQDMDFDFDSSLSTTPTKCAKQKNVKRDHAQEKKTIPEQEKVGLKKNG